MSYPQKSDDLRSLTINATKYRWRFSSGECNGTLLVYGPTSGHQSLLVALTEWRDPWLAFPVRTSNQPKAIGPGFVRRAIEFGLAHGWQPESKDSPQRIEYKNDHFSAQQ